MAFKELVRSHFQEFFDNKLIEYISAETNEGIEEEQRITLGQWFGSIINHEERQNYRDLLSPPPGCRDPENPYGMGAFKIPSQGHALLEVRAYAVRDVESGRAVTIDKFDTFMQGEINWFFDELTKKGDA